uniref:Uncharacterized protein n=1 Tax=Parascaris univalens TaxID=6257 RepID=A0A915BW98_PARUN
RGQKILKERNGISFRCFRVRVSRNWKSMSRILFQQLLVVVYKTIERLKEVNQLGEDQQAKLYEKIADEFYELDLRELSLDFYKLMLRCAKTIREQTAASVSWWQ